MSKQKLKQPDRLKRVVIKEELVELTGDYIAALALNQLIYWSERVRDYDKMLEEEKERLNMTADVKPKNGWIWKSAGEFIEELMIGCSEGTMRNRLQKIVDNSWAYRRRNPDDPQDRTYQYRVDIIQIQKDLLKIGYSLDRYPVIVDRVSNLNDCGSNLNDCASNLNDYGSDLNDCGSNLSSCASNLNDCGTLPETTTEITTETTTKTNSEIKKKYIKKKIDKKNFKKLNSEMLKFLKAELNNPSFNTWFSDLTPVDLKGDIFVFKVPTDFIKEWIEMQYLDSMKSFLKIATGDDIDIKLMVND